MTSDDRGVLRRDALHRTVQRVADLLDMADDDDIITATRKRIAKLEGGR